ncbi:hypothetical protein MD484_g5575, partial [Candolleomyces efflorescens]
MDVDDEKKPFDAVGGGIDDDSHPDPDEELMLEQGQGKVWIIKIPKFLKERWSAIDQEDVHLASIRIYDADPNDPNPKRRQRPKIVLFLPPNRDPINGNPSGTGSFHSLNGSLSQSAAPSPNNTAHGIPTPPPSYPNSQTPAVPSPSATPPAPAAGGAPSTGASAAAPAAGPISFIHPSIDSWPFFDPANSIPTTGSDPDIYEMEMINESLDNQIVVAERPKEQYPNIPHNPRARMVILTGKIRHEANLRPAFSSSYRRQMRERNRKANTPARQVMMIEQAKIPGGKGGINRLSAGVGMGAGRAFSDAIKAKQKNKAPFERMARMPRNQLLDHLFSSFRESPRWAIKVLREKTQQPEAYLKEVLSEIAFLHRSGEFNGFWELKANYKDDSITPENVPMPMASLAGEVKMEEDDDDDDEDGDDDDDEDMEEVS